MSTTTSIDPSYSEIVTQEKCTIVTSRPLTLTQDTKAPPEHFQVPKTTDLEVFGDEVTISGRIQARSKSIKIFARVLTLASVKTPSGFQPAELNVDGAEGAKQTEPVPLAVGEPGKTGFNDCIEPFPVAGCQWKGGGNGQSANDVNLEWAQGSSDPNLAGFQWKPENAWMHGAAGLPGKRGDDAGSIIVVCDSFGPVEQALILSTNGGRGGQGQTGQDGAKGGDGGAGSNAVGNTGAASLGYKNATPGGNGGLGGNGGKGGKGGDGGNGGRIVFRCVNAKKLPGDKIKLLADGGERGSPGVGGKPGGAGLKGLGGSGAGHRTPPFGVEQHLSGSYDGQPGVEGCVGNVPGDPGSDGRHGSIERTMNATYAQLKSLLRTAIR